MMTGAEMGVYDIGFSGLALSYILLIFPLAVILWLKAPIIGTTATAVLRMTVQLLLVGLYLQFIFDLNDFRLTGLWLLIMLVVADLSILSSCGLKVRRFYLHLLAGLSAGALIPLFTFVGLLLRRPNILDAQYAIPIAGMILGNCMRAVIVGLDSFYSTLASSSRQYLQRLALGATQQEALLPYMSDAIRRALNPTIANMATIGLVSLPGMMTGVILGGADPMIAIKYQAAIMIAILSGTAITVFLSLWLSIRSAFSAYGILDRTIFSDNMDIR